MLLKSRASLDMLPFSLCNKKRLAIRHMNRPLFPTTLSIPSYDIGKYVVLRTYQHPHVRNKTLPSLPDVANSLVFWFVAFIEMGHNTLVGHGDWWKRSAEFFTPD